MKLAILGSGYMAKAIAGGLCQKKVLPKESILMINPVDEASALEFSKSQGILFGKKEDLFSADVMIAAFKPQNLKEAMAMYAPYFHQGQLFISIMAGIEIDTIEALLPCKMAVIRTMPNLALSVSKSATAYALGNFASQEDGKICEKLFGALGVVKQAREEDISIVTALSGSGPAYFYLLAEAMTKAAVNLGLAEDTAKALCKQAFLGTALLWERDDAPAEEMRRRITSKKGTTEAAVLAMEREGFSLAAAAGVIAAKERSDELAREMK